MPPMLHPRVMLQLMTQQVPIEDTQSSALIDAARSGDRQAFEALYRQTIGMVYGLCLRLTGNRAAAEDCVQQTYVQAWRNLQRFRGDSELTTWLHRIAVNEVRGLYRRESRHPPSGEDTPVGTPFNPNTTMDLERAIGDLPEQARAVFVLVGVYGYPHREAAAMLDIAEGTSKAHFHRARQLLRERLGATS